MKLSKSFSYVIFFLFPTGTLAGGVVVFGTFYSSDKNFKIDHPLDPSNNYLVQVCVESSERINIYNGNIVSDASGSAEVKTYKRNVVVLWKIMVYTMMHTQKIIIWVLNRRRMSMRRVNISFPSTLINLRNREYIMWKLSCPKLKRKIFI
jgi:hypothetical protein